MSREARLKTAFAGEYPTLEPGVWHTAAATAAHVKATLILSEGANVEIRNRVLTPAHFEFRGGDRRQGAWVGMLTRRADRNRSRSRLITV